MHHHPLLLPAGQLRRRLQLHLLARNFGGEGPRWALHDNVAHSSPNPLPDGTVPIGAPVATGFRPREDPTGVPGDPRAVGCRDACTHPLTTAKKRVIRDAGRALDPGVRFQESMSIMRGSST
ncbi:hypothetical protein F750_5242 [Streptomyces sp. PAMC 26508]|nr:hypothetical protein F750_5242 [Streptomyces sp. PAMC 26508]